MGCATSKPTIRGSRNKGADPELDRNKQNNHIIRDGVDDRSDQFSAVGGQRPDVVGEARGHSASSANRSRVGCSDRKCAGHSDRKSAGHSDRISRSNAIGVRSVTCKQLIPKPIITANPRIPQLGVRIITLKASIDKKPTSLDEKSSAVLKYRTPHFRASAVVEIPDLSEKKTIRIGWIQTCCKMKFINTYGQEGVTSWEFPEIVTGRYKMISDADGNLYPWYGSKQEVRSVDGPTDRQTVTVHMNDNFFPQVTWYIPHSSYDRTARLTHIHREQSFYTFLVAMDPDTNTYYVLKTISWSMTINIAVCPDSPLGRRARLLEPLEQTAPVILTDGRHVKPEPYAMRPPNANNSQVLVWRPAVGEPKVVVPSEETTVNMNSYLQTTRDYVCQVAQYERES